MYFVIKTGIDRNLKIQYMAKMLFFGIRNKIARVFFIFILAGCCGTAIAQTQTKVVLTYTTPTSYSVVIPPGVDSAKGEAWGGGGGGGGAAAYGNMTFGFGGGGGGGGYAICNDLTGGTVTIVVGKGGNGGEGMADGSDGGISIIGSCFASGGEGGKLGYNGGGAGGKGGTGRDSVTLENDGTSGTSGSTGSGGNGGKGVNGGQGGIGSGNVHVASSPGGGGAGGAGGPSRFNNWASGNAYAGANGQVIITYWYTSGITGIKLAQGDTAMCFLVGDSLYIDPATMEGLTPNSYIWYKNDTLYTNATSCIPDGPGTYKVKVGFSISYSNAYTVTKNSINLDSKIVSFEVWSNEITVSAVSAPAALSISGLSATYAPGDSLKVVGSANDGGAPDSSYTWILDGNDPKIGTGKNLSYELPAALSPGGHTLKLVVRNCGGDNFIESTFTISAASVSTVSGATAVCAGGTVTLTGGPAPGGTWAMTDGGSTGSTINSSTGEITAGNTAGTIKVTYTASGYTPSPEYALTVNPKPVITPSGTSTCYNGSLSLSVDIADGTWSVAPSADGSISGSGTSYTFIGTVAHSERTPAPMTATYTSPAGCASQPLNLTINPSPFTLQDATISRSICQIIGDNTVYKFDDYVKTEYDYAWHGDTILWYSDGTVTTVISPTPTYTVDAVFSYPTRWFVVTDNKGCQSPPVSFDISIVASLTQQPFISTRHYWVNGYNHTWFNLSQTHYTFYEDAAHTTPITNDATYMATVDDAAGTYPVYFRFVDGQNCEVDGDFDVVIHGKPAITFGKSDTICNPGTPATTTLSVAVTGDASSYKAVIEHANGTQKTASATASSPIDFTIGVSEAGTYHVVSLEATYPGSITLEVPVADLPSNTATVVVATAPVADVNISGVSSSYCAGQSLTPTAPTINWNNSARSGSEWWTLDGTTVTPPEVLTYADNGKKLAYWVKTACNTAVGIKIDSVSITVHDKPAFTLPDPATPVCEGLQLREYLAISTIPLDPKGASISSWELLLNGDTLQKGIEPSVVITNHQLNYADNGKVLKLTATNACGITEQTITLSLKQKPRIANKAYTICSGAAFTMQPDGSDVVPAGTTYTWTVSTNANISTTSGSISAVEEELNAQSTLSRTLYNESTSEQSITYSVTPTANGCAAPFSVDVTVRPRPKVTVETAPDSVICEDEPYVLRLVGTPPFTLEYTVNGNTPATYGLGTTFDTQSGSDYLLNLVSGSVYEARVTAGKPGNFVFELTEIKDHNNCESKP
jgi:hypothetical protein